MWLAPKPMLRPVTAPPTLAIGLGDQTRIDESNVSLKLNEMIVGAYTPKGGVYADEIARRIGLVNVKGPPLYTGKGD